MSTIGDNIKRRRLEKRLTLEELARAIGTSKQTIQRYESGVIGNIPSDKIEALADALGVSPAYLMGWESDEQTSPDAERQRLIETAKVALFTGGGEVTDEMWDEVVRFAQYIEAREAEKKDENK